MAETLTPEEDQARLVVDALRRLRGLSVTGLAGRAGVSRQTASDKLIGNRRIGLTDTRKFADALGVPPLVFYMEPDDAIRWALDHPESRPTLTNLGWIGPTTVMPYITRSDLLRAA